MKTFLLLLLSTGTAIFAQQPALEAGGQFRSYGEPGKPPIAISPLVKGVPYSAEAVTESVQTLPDGNRVTEKTSSPVYRDGQGRQRREVTITGSGPMNGRESILILDPVAGAIWTLNPSSKSASRGEYPAPRTPPPARPPIPTSPTGGSIGVIFRQGPGESRVVVDSAVPGGPAAGAGLQKNDVILAINGQAVKDGDDMVTRINQIAPDSPLQITFEREGKSSTVAMITAARATTFGTPEPTIQPALSPEERVTLRAGLNTVQSMPTREDLGTMNIEGLPARGSRMTLTYAAGEDGNEQPLSVVNEVWYSADLQAILVSKHSDPRSGDVTWRLTEINRNEPPASVFEVPGDYTVR